MTRTVVRGGVSDNTAGRRGPQSTWEGSRAGSYPLTGDDDAYLSRRQLRLASHGGLLHTLGIRGCVGRYHRGLCEPLLR